MKRLSALLSIAAEVNPKAIALILVITMASLYSFAQQKADNIIIVTLDGFRWQELFNGADAGLINDTFFVSDTGEIKKLFWAETPAERRKKLLPFFWSTVANEGQLHGNRAYGSKCNVMNRYWFSYPGYNEIFTGFSDTAVNSNDKVLNENENVLEFLNKQKVYKSKVAAFTSWDVFPFILNEKRSGIYVNADVDSFPFSSPAFQLLNQLQFLSPKPLGLRTDIATYLAARQYLKEFKPKLLYIAFDETDDYAHNGRYDQYLISAHALDGMIRDLWNLIQYLPEYKNTTSLIITCDHGRGNRNKEEWKGHGSKIPGSGETWMAFLGKGIPAKGEIRKEEQVYQAQIAQTIAQLAGFYFKSSHPVEKNIDLNK
jgi:PglZ domain